MSVYKSSRRFEAILAAVDEFIVILVICVIVLFTLSTLNLLSFTLFITLCSIVVILLSIIVAVIIKAQLAKPRIGIESMIGKIGLVSEVKGDKLIVMVNGEYWRAKSDEKLSEGDKVIIYDVNGLLLKVKRVKENLKY